MIFAETPKNRKRPAGVLFSAAAHVAVLAMVYVALRSGRTYPITVQSRCCSTALYWSPNANSGSPKPQLATHQKRSSPSPSPVAKPGHSWSPAAAAQVAQAQTGVTSPEQLASLGIGSDVNNGEPALPSFFPSPDIADRSLLPAAKQNIVVEVNINPLGQVTDEKLVRGLGNALDQIVLNTVKGWRFHPATLNGSAIASVEELVFPFDKNWQPNAAGSFEG
jgi:TonB family protein